MTRKAIAITTGTASFSGTHDRGLAARVAANLAVTITLWIARHRQRQALRQLAERNDYLLRDIGALQCDALRESAKWFWQH